MSAETFTLSWHTFSDHLREMLHEMMKSNKLTDVTLVCDDKRQFKAHKIVLSACSTIFKYIIDDLPQSNTVIYLKGIQHQEMESILKFIYLGEATVCQDRMKTFVKVARNLEIKDFEEEKVTFRDPDIKNVTEAPKQMNDASETNSTVYMHTEDKVTFEEPNIKDSTVLPLLIDVVSEEKSLINQNLEEESHNMQSKEQGKTNQETSENQLTVKGITFSKDIEVNQFDEKLICYQCNKQFSNSKSLQRHIRTTHEGIKDYCDQCDKPLAQYSLKQHLRIVHEDIRYDCNQCPHKARSKSNLGQHIRSIHGDKSFLCDQCDYQAATEVYLKAHVESKHEGVKYSCEQCNQHYVNASNLRHHFLSVHGGVNYACNQCDYQSTRKRNLTIHMKSKHDVFDAQLITMDRSTEQFCLTIV